MSVDRCDQCGEPLDAAVAEGPGGERLHPHCIRVQTLSQPPATVLMYERDGIGPLSPDDLRT